MSGNDGSDVFAEGRRRMEEIESKLSGLFNKKESKGGSLLGGLGALVENLITLAEESERVGKAVNKSGEFNIGADKRTKGVYGFSVKTGIGDTGPKVESFGNIRRDESGSLVEVHEVREPIIDIFDESSHLLIVAEVPGITDEDIKLELIDDILLLSAENGENRYLKEVLLPTSFTMEQMSSICRNGMLEIRLSK